MNQPPKKPSFNLKNSLFWLSFCLLKILALMPRAVHQCMAWLGAKWALKKPGYRSKIAKRNLELCFPERAHEILPQHFYSSNLGLFESLAVWFSSKKNLPSFDIEGLEHINQAREKGKGVLLLIPHWVHLELAGALCSQVFPLSGLYRPMKDKRFDWMIYTGRMRHYHDLIPRDDIKQMIRALRKNHVVGYAPDQDYGPHQAHFIPFFGTEAAYLNAPFRLAKLTGCEVIPAGFVRNEFGKHYTIQFFPALASFHEDESKALSSMNVWLESVIEQHPEDYLWNHRRFKTRPDGEPSLYQVHDFRRFSHLKKKREKCFSERAILLHQGKKSTLKMIDNEVYLEYRKPGSWIQRHFGVIRAQKCIRKMGKNHPMLRLKRLYLDSHQYMVASFVIKGHQITSWHEYKQANPSRALKVLEDFVSRHHQQGMSVVDFESERLWVVDDNLLYLSFFGYVEVAKISSSGTKQDHEKALAKFL